MTNAWLTCSRLRSRHFEVVGERENGRARGRQATRALSFTIDKSIRKNQKQLNIQRFFNATASANLSDYNYCTYFYLISVFLHTVLYFIKKWFIVTNFTLARLFRNPAISNFFPFPLGLRNSGVRLYIQMALYWIIWYRSLNYVLWGCRRNQTLPVITAFSSKVKIKYETEKSICVKTNKQENFNKKWALPLDQVTCVLWTYFFYSYFSVKVYSVM